MDVLNFESWLELLWESWIKSFCRPYVALCMDTSHT